MKPIIFDATREEVILHILDIESKQIVIDNGLVQQTHTTLLKRFLTVNLDRAVFIYKDTILDKAHKRAPFMWNDIRSTEEYPTIVFISPTIANCAMNMANDTIEKYGDCDDISDNQYAKFLKLLEFGIKRCGGESLNKIESSDEEIRNNRNRMNICDYFNHRIAYEELKRTLEQE